MSNVNLIKLQHFFEVDTKIKKELYNCVPPSLNGYLDEVSLCKYTDSLEDSLIYIFSELKCVALDIFGENSVVLERIEYLEQATKNNFYACGLDITKLRNFYKKYISDMNPIFVDKVKTNCIGYTLFNDLPINMTNSINEMLHLIHSYVLNNENILQSIPIVSQKQNTYAYPIVLRGSHSELFEQLFEQFPIELDVGYTDLVSLNERKLLMMVRDRGHALTVEITINNNIARLEYFIPKICNVDMVNALPGVNKVNDNSIGTTGIIETDINYLPGVLFDFVSKVPTDGDMIYENRTR